MRVLLTGAGGFVGSHVARALLARGDEVVAVVRPGGSVDRIADVESELSIVRADLGTADLDGLTRTVAPDACIHLAWHVEPGGYLTSVPENLASLAAATRLLSALDANRCPRAVIAGTCLEPGSLIDGEVRPPATIYAAAKTAQHEVAMHLDATAVACAHIFYVYGPGEDPRRLVPSVIRACLDGRGIAVTAGEQRRDFLHVEDVAAAVVAIASSGLRGGVDVCSGANRPLREVFDAIGAATGRPDLIAIGGRPAAAEEPEEIAGDAAPLLGIGWRPRRELDAGIAQTVDWWRRGRHDPTTRAATDPIGASESAR